MSLARWHSEGIQEEKEGKTGMRLPSHEAGHPWKEQHTKGVRPGDWSGGIGAPGNETGEARRS